ncbi:AsmA family protein [Roseomonas gilardii subsp. gilardii]|uniref:AsmA family protein n=1 Tax=Roseomonas gilardii TaxID=257708 RepID=UPI001FFB3B30|nr:AsmA family protein [Roseomonas gilardii]UPG74188.1 AsmA family protein [Roseomonas gilardii subsp. gilardii]
MIRWAIRIMLSLAGLLLLALAGGWWLLPHLDLGPVAGRIGGALLGRELAFAGLKVVPGHWTSLEVRGLRLAGPPGLDGAPMLEIADAKGELDLLSLFQGPPVLRHLSVSGLRLRLERAPDGTGNWHFHGTPTGGTTPGQKPHGTDRVPDQGTEAAPRPGRRRRRRNRIPCRPSIPPAGRAFRRCWTSS